MNDIDKIFYSDDNKPYVVNPDDPVNYWYNMTLYDTNVYNFNINYNPDINITKLWINVPVFNEKRQPLGMVGTGIDISTFISNIYEDLSSNTDLYFFNANGEITGAKNVELIKEKVNIEEYLGENGVGVIETAKKLSAGDTMSIDALMCKTVIGKVPSLDWYSVAVSPDSISDYDSPLTIFYLVVIAVIAILVVVFNLFMAELHKPLKRTMTELETAKNEAVEANRSKSNFLATVSHEIRTPMNAIIGISEIQMQRSNLDPDLEEALDKIRGSGQILLGIINDILDLSKIETGKLELNPAEYDVPDFINDTVALNIGRIGSKPIEFKLNIDDSLPVRLIGDELRLKQILNNLLSNAFKYTQEGVVMLSIDAMTTDCGVMLRFKVSDTGQGMKPEDLERLFTQYSRFNAEANRSTEGTGLGLSITKNLVTMMSGEISVESEYGKGSVFTAAVLQQLVDQRIIGPELVKDLCEFSYTPGKQSEKLRFAREPMPYGSVLVVDDVETNLYVARGLLSPYSLKIDTAISGFEAIEKIQNNALYDVIFMDHMMPGMDGIETVRKLRSSGYNAPIIALTANAIAGNDVMFKENGFDAFISKPIDIRQLDEALHKFVRRGRKRVSSTAAITDIADVTPKPDFTITDVDVTAGVRNVGGNVENYIKTLELFCKDADARLLGIPESLASKEYKLFTTHAHAIKSAAANIGALRLSELAKDLETAAKAGDLKYIDEYTGSFLKALENVMKNITAFLSERTPAQTEKPENTGETSRKLERLKTALLDLDISTIDEITAELSRLSSLSIIDEITQGVLMSDYDAVIALIDKHLENTAMRAT